MSTDRFANIQHIQGNITDAQPNIKSITMTTESTTKQRKPRTARNFDSILKGALAMPLNERVGLVNKLKDSIHAEVETVKAAAAQAEKISSEL